MIDIAPLAIPGAVALWVVVRIFGALMTDEVKGSMPILCRALVRDAVKRLPGADQQRWDEEWCAELYAKRARPLSALKYAIGIRLSVRAHLAALVDGESPDSEAGKARISKQLGEIRGQYDDGYITAREMFEASRLLTKGMGWRTQTRQLVGKLDGNAPLLWTLVVTEVTYIRFRFKRNHWSS